MSLKISVVIVTFNRLCKLKKALTCYEKQSLYISDIIVVNNHSTDGTNIYLEKWKNSSSFEINKHIITTEKNVGGAGGFSLGIEKALTLNPDWIWVADDDAYPFNESFSILIDKIEKYKNSNIACICGSVYSGDNIDIDHRRITHKGIIWKPIRVLSNRYNEEYIEIDESSFVGSCYKASVISFVGLPNSEFFIYFDDTEYSHRIRKQGKILLLPEIKIFHDTTSYVPESNVLVSWRDYYLLRNHIYTLKKYHFFTFLLYSVFKFFKSIVDFAKNRNYKSLKLNVLAIKDGFEGKLGVHKLYKPGFDIIR